MNSIRSKILSVLIGSIAIVGICAFIVLSVNQQSVSLNQKIIDRMTSEYGIISMTDNLISSYNDASKSPGDTNTQARYQANKIKILEVIAMLKSQVVSVDGMASLVGVGNTVDSVISETDAGLSEMATNNFDNISVHFAQANTNNDFVRINVQTLIQKELDYLAGTQANTKRVYAIGIYTSIGLFILVVLVMLFISSSFSKQLVTPIELLSKTAGRVAAGEMDTPIDQKLLSQKDEVGILASSFAFMVNTVKAKIAELSTSNKELENSKTALENGNAELEKLNSFMVDREVKMVELKKKISELEKK